MSKPKRPRRGLGITPKDEAKLSGHHNDGSVVPKKDGNRAERREHERQYGKGKA